MVPNLARLKLVRFGSIHQKHHHLAFYQFWLNSADADVYKFLRYFTFLPLEEIDSIEAADLEAQGRPQAQAVLAREATRLVHGEEGLAAALRITEALFSGDPNQLPESDFEQLRLDGMPSSELSLTDVSGKPLTSLLVECGMAKAGREIKDALGRNSVFYKWSATGCSRQHAIGGDI